MTKRILNERLKEIRQTLSWMQQQVNNNKVDELGRDTFDHDYADEYDPE